MNPPSPASSSSKPRMISRSTRRGCFPVVIIVVGYASPLDTASPRPD
jgi:hypothetical protein